MGLVFAFDGKDFREGCGVCAFLRSLLCFICFFWLTKPKKSLMAMKYEFPEENKCVWFKFDAKSGSFHVCHTCISPCFTKHAPRFHAFPKYSMTSI
jgi:hypothetical protein